MEFEEDDEETQVFFGLFWADTTPPFRYTTYNYTLCNLILKEQLNKSNISTKDLYV